MITLLSKIFIKPEYSDEKRRTLVGVLCGALGITLNIFLFIFKLLAGVFTGSVSILADAFNNLSDAGSSLITLLGFKLAGQKPDREHPYGHGRMEYLSGFVVSCIIIVMGFELFKDSISKIIHPEAVDFSIMAIVILVLAILVKLYMFFYNSKAGEKYNSAPLKATAFDSISDCIATTVVLITSIIGYYTSINLDGWAGVIVSCFIFYAGYSAAKESISPLLGSAPEREFIEQITNIVVNFDPENIVGLHDLMVHDYGPGRRILSLHAEVPAHCDIVVLHDIIDNLEKELWLQLGCVTTIHMDPIVTNDPKVLELKEKVNAISKKIYNSISIHDFRVVYGDTHTNLIFDMAVPFECPLTNDEIITRARILIWEEIGEGHYAAIEVDRDNYINDL